LDIYSISIVSPINEALDIELVSIVGVETLAEVALPPGMWCDTNSIDVSEERTAPIFTVEK
jgi:hypothetical protein